MALDVGGNDCNEFSLEWPRFHTLESRPAECGACRTLSELEMLCALSVPRHAQDGKNDRASIVANGDSQIGELVCAGLS